MSSSDLSSILVIFAGVVATFIGLFTLTTKQSAKEREADRLERREFAEAIKDMAISNRDIAKETRKGNNEAKLRNGHLGEQNVEIVKLVKSTKLDLMSAVTNVENQHVQNQTVDNEIVAK